MSEKSTKNSTVSMQELNDFLKKYPDIEFVDMLIPDSNAILRGKRVYRDKFESCFLQGISMASCVFAVDSSGAYTEIKGFHWAETDCDKHCKIIPNTLGPMTWQTTPSAQVLMSMYEQDDTDFSANPRNVLKNIIELLKKDGLTAVSATELEFYLIDNKRNRKTGIPRPTKKTDNKKRDYSISIYSLDDVDEIESFIEEVMDTSKKQGIQTDKVVSEESPGQFEINLYHHDDALRVCDETILLKRIIKKIAAKHKVQATFMAKPYGNYAGNGMHFHASVLDDDGNNIFRGNIEKNGAKMSKKLLWAIGGLQALMFESVLLFAPNMNSFRRIEANYCISNSNSWGVNNRTVAIRVPSGPIEEVRIEYRLPGGDANPYLAMSAILAGIHYGIKNQIEPTEPILGDALKSLPNNIPTNWMDAIDSFHTAKVLPEYLGKDFCSLYYQCRLAEYQKLSAYVNPIEYEWYLKNI